MSDDTRATELREGLAGMMDCSTWNNLSIPVRYENKAFTQPTATPWAAFTILEPDTRRNNMGNKRRITRGILCIQIFIPVGGGTKRAREIANAISTIFSETPGIRTDNGYFNFEVTRMDMIGEREGWHQSNALTNFRFYYLQT